MIINYHEKCSKMMYYNENILIIVKNKITFLNSHVTCQNYLTGLVYLQVYLDSTKRIDKKILR